jgi:hypothetical protein
LRTAVPSFETSTHFRGDVVLIPRVGTKKPPRRLVAEATARHHERGAEVLLILEKLFEDARA